MLELLESHTRAAAKNDWRVWTVFPRTAFGLVVCLLVIGVSAPIVGYIFAWNEFSPYFWTVVPIVSLVLTIAIIGYLVYAPKAYRIFLDKRGKRIFARPIFFGNLRSVDFDKADIWIGTRSDRQLTTAMETTNSCIDEVFTSSSTKGLSLYLSLDEFEKPVTLRRNVEPVHKYLLYEFAKLLGKSIQRQSD